VYFESILWYFEAILLYLATMLPSGCIENRYSKGKEQVVINVHLKKQTSLLLGYHLRLFLLNLGVLVFYHFSMFFPFISAFWLGGRGKTTSTELCCDQVNHGPWPAVIATHNCTQNLGKGFGVEP